MAERHERKDQTDRPRRPAITDQLSLADRQALERTRIRFVLALGRALHRYGTPANRLEEALAVVCGRLGLSAQIMSTPTSLTVGFGDPAELRTGMMRVDTGELDLGKLAKLDALAEQVIAREIDSDEGIRRIESIERAPQAWSRAARTVTYASSAVSFAVFFGGGWRDLAAAAVCGLTVGLVALFLRREHHSARALELVGAFAAALCAGAAARLVPGVTPSIVTISSLIAFIPGLTLTVAMTELATRNLVSGTGRLMSAVVVLLELALGVALGERVAHALWTLPPPEPGGLPGWAAWAAVVAGALGMAVVVQAEKRALGWILAACMLGFAGSRVGAYLLGPELGVLIGALALGIGANLYARLLDRPQQVILTPATILLVPGSMGFRGISSLLDRNTLTGIETTFATFVVAMAIVAGLLLANALVSPRRVL